jgi:hypothetical protein
VSIVAHPAQRAPASGAPQFVQKCPLAGSPHDGHLAAVPDCEALEGGTVMR